MAEEENKQAQEEQGEKKSGNMLMIIIIAVLVLIIIIGAVLAVVLMSGDDENVSEAAPMAKQRVAPSRTKSTSSVVDNSRRLSEIGILYPLDTFTVNLKSDSGRRYLKATISLELSGEELSLELDAKAPVIRDRVIRILTSKTLEEISSKKGKQKVSDQIMDTLNSIISDGSIQGIYFTEFVIQ
ncbi:MAG: flagellar basal body-associated protein FliL [Thiovulaceae bacterium]|jgi:flagellar FliL protein|nr:flagellar basal body-associated protein FliL [Sulfurimonadaceae bacterium]MCW9026202.1 flagellar basal body-associated protein FliL [Sulfurimonadaceae bacterium]